MSIRQLIREELRGMRPYSAAEQVTDTIRLNANESAWKSDADHFRRPLNRYPEIRPAGLRALLAERFGCDERELLVTRGSSEAIDLLIRVFCNGGVDNIVTTPPTFSMYEHYASIQNAAVRTVALDPDDDWALDTDALLAACDENTKLVFLCSPNNPTGTSIRSAQLNDILDRIDGRYAVVVDEAYIEFSPEPSSTASRSRFDNLIVLRTLSKALAYAGARCGCVIAQQEVIAILDAVQAPYALATPVVEAVENALRGDLASRAADEVADTIEERNRVTQNLNQMGIVDKVFPSDANFLLVKFGNAAEVLDRTREAGVLVRAYGGGLESCIRISIGSQQENDALLDALTSMEIEK
ncbi:MAG: histidinol-phosphate transaminase [Woeseiaceae bacterium]|nr:histidinol-phosphate transaminase [Woeseiaceae bacterium]